MAPALVKSLNRLSRERIIDLALTWLQESRAAVPYLLNNRTGFEADEEDYLHEPAESIEQLRKYYHGLRKDTSQTAKRDLIDRIVDGDWRRGLSLHQHATIDFANLEQNDAALRWSALKLVALDPGARKSVDSNDDDDDDDSCQPPKKKRKTSHDLDTHYPQVSPQVFLSTLKAEVCPLVKAHYHLHRMPPPYNLTILRMYITPNSAFAPPRSRRPGQPKHATDAGRIMYIALPDSCPYVYISISGPSAPSSNARTRGHGARAATKEKLFGRVDMAAMKRIVLEGLPKALSRPQQRWAMESTRLVARSLKTMCELRGNGQPGSCGGAYSGFIDRGESVDRSPVDVQMSEDDAVGKNITKAAVERRFGHMSGEHYAVLDRVHVKLRNVVEPDDKLAGDNHEDSRLSAAHSADTGCDIMLNFSGSDVFQGLKKLAELGSQYIDLDKMPAWMTGELGLSSVTV